MAEEGGAMDKDTLKDDGQCELFGGKPDFSKSWFNGSDYDATENEKSSQRRNTH